MYSSDVFAIVARSVNIFKLNSRFAAIAALFGAGIILANELQHIKNRAALGNGNCRFFKNISVLRQESLLFGAKIGKIVENRFALYLNRTGYCFGLLFRRGNLRGLGNRLCRNRSVGFGCCGFCG